MQSCPRCRIPLTKRGTPNGWVYGCPKCGGRAATLPVLRKAGASAEFLEQVWSKGRHGARGGIRCPHCNRAMARVVTQAARVPVSLDVCPSCTSVWLDRDEFESLAKLPPSLRGEQFPEASRQQLATTKARMTPGEDYAIVEIDDGDPDEAWQWIPAFFGLPAEFGGTKLASAPWATWGIAGALVTVFVCTHANLEAAAREWGFIPAQWARRGGLTFLTVFFLHVGIAHLLSNLYFLLVFGDNVEDSLGRVGFVALLAAATAAGGLSHMMYDPHTDVPCAGASAGVCGVLGYYAVAFPRAKLGFLWVWPLWLWSEWVYHWIRFPAVAALFLFLAVQVFGAWQQIAGFGDVSYLAHLGGIAVGVATALAVRLFRRLRCEKAISAA